jgi:hypothetical protein
MSPEHPCPLLCGQLLFPPALGPQSCVDGVSGKWTGTVCSHSSQASFTEHHVWEPPTWPTWSLALFIAERSSTPAGSWLCRLDFSVGEAAFAASSPQHIRVFAEAAALTFRLLCDCTGWLLLRDTSFIRTGQWGMKLRCLQAHGWNWRTSR